MKPSIFILPLLSPCLYVAAQIPVTDVANLMSNEVSHLETIVKWGESIAQLRQQIVQLDQQISIQSEMRKWAGDPAKAGAKMGLDLLGQDDLVRSFGKTKSAVLESTTSLASLTDTANGTYRPITDVDLAGEKITYDDATFRRYAVLNAKQANAEEVATQTADRTAELQDEMASTLSDLKSADTEAEAQKLSAKLTALSGQLAQIETERKRQVDEVSLQKIANDSRIEQERLAADELEEKDAYLANQKVTSYMKTLHVSKATQ